MSPAHSDSEGYRSRESAIGNAFSEHHRTYIYDIFAHERWVHGAEVDFRALPACHAAFTGQSSTA
ncbi:hypothetical protein LAUMK35_02659 [Mycobacterium pseudokansasii]|uniref:Uncharacterized protein n=1 Tax=Mycobacterium pseudokansasii TaxID=2341080 RepID=A0A498QRX0_9MYCO|nr:hypothetical protein A4G27_26225 [Mycobacterium kansasii]VAZ94564.1 hypothetical protein LAUMK35_02659 [Mycobacterium pseudokansasii]VAZ95618.1 hypothetical protein LAUMK21_02658 [Mycobacterium pseudokansasii]VBA50362.1 hypothetical protein LAUMK142_02550 [Mycobacterium pseudokansasii]